MEIENTEVRIALTIREAQSLLCILDRVGVADRAKKLHRVSLQELPAGVISDAIDIEFELRNLLNCHLHSPSR